MYPGSTSPGVDHDSGENMLERKDAKLSWWTGGTLLEARKKQPRPLARGWIFRGRLADEGWWLPANGFLIAFEPSSWLSGWIFPLNP